MNTIRALRRPWNPVCLYNCPPRSSETPQIGFLDFRPNNLSTPHLASTLVYAYSLLPPSSLPFLSSPLFPRSFLCLINFRWSFVSLCSPIPAPIHFRPCSSGLVSFRTKTKEIGTKKNCSASIICFDSLSLLFSLTPLASSHLRFSYLTRFPYHSHYFTRCVPSLFSLPSPLSFPPSLPNLKSQFGECSLSNSTLSAAYCSALHSQRRHLYRRSVRPHILPIRRFSMPLLFPNIHRWSYGLHDPIL